MGMNTAPVLCGLGVVHSCWFSGSSSEEEAALIAEMPQSSKPCSQSTHRTQRESQDYLLPNQLNPDRHWCCLYSTAQERSTGSARAHTHMHARACDICAPDYAIFDI